MLINSIDTKASQFQKEATLHGRIALKLFYLSGTVMLPSRIFAFASSTAFFASSDRFVVVKSTPPSFRPKVVVLPPGNLPLAVWLAMSWTVLPTCFKLDAKTKLDSLPSLDLYLPSSVWSRSTPSTQTGHAHSWEWKSSRPPAF